MDNMRRRTLVTGTLMVSLIVLTGCIGIYNNSDVFFNPPETGTSELELLKDFGAPDFAETTREGKVYVYKVRDVKYIILVGIYDGHDMVVVMQDGVVVQTRNVQRPKAFTLFQPIPWAVAD